MPWAIRRAMDLRLPEWTDWDRYYAHQQPVVEEIVARFQEGNQLVCLVGPTGCGKTIVAEAVRQTLNLRGLYLCTSLTLMDQFVRGFPYARQIRGRRNYTPTNVEPDDRITCEDCDYDEERRACTFCPETEECPYRVAKHSARIARLACSNTSYFLREVQAQKSSFKGKAFVTLDEAHAAEQELLSYISISISERMQKMLGLQPPTKKTKQEAWEMWFAESIPLLKDRLENTPTRNLREQRQHRALENLVEKMQQIVESLDGFIYDGYKNGRIEFKPINVERFGMDSLFNHGKRWLAMSATLIPEHFVSSLGYEGAWAPVFAPSTFPKENRPIYYCPSAFMTKTQEPEELPKMVRAVRAVLNRHPNERILVHTHSYNLTKSLHGSLRVLNRPVFAYTNAQERESIIALYEQTPNAVLLAPSLEQGYDGAGEKCSVVVIAKVPYANLGDKQVSARLHSKGGEYSYAATTAIALMQSLGRHIRSETETGTAYILDSMFGTFFRKWTVSDGHKFFPDHMLEAFHWDSSVRFELTRAVRTLASSTPVA